MDYWPKFFALTYLKICFQLAHSLVMFLWDFASPDHLIATSWRLTRTPELLLWHPWQQTQHTAIYLWMETSRV